MFKLPHLIFMLLTLITAPYLAIYLKRLMPQQLHRFMGTMTIIVLCFDPAYWVWEWINFQSFKWSTTLPLYLCSLFWILLPFAVHSKSPFIKRMARANIASVVLFAGVFGLVFNTHLNLHPFFSFVPIRSLLYHYLMIFISLSFWTTGYYKPLPKDGLLSMIPVFILLVPCIALSYLMGWDYAFTAGGLGTPLEAISSLMPRPLYLLTLYGFATLVIQLFFLGMNHFFCHPPWAPGTDARRGNRLTTPGVSTGCPRRV